MIPKTNRIRKPKEFAEIFKKGQKITRSFFNIYVLQPTDQRTTLKAADISMFYDKDGKFIWNKAPTIHKETKQKNKYGVIISAKFGKAHDRNKFKRRVKYHLAHSIPQNGIYILIKVTKPIPKMKYSDIAKELSAGLLS